MDISDQRKNSKMKIKIECSLAELLDKISILRIKRDVIKAPEKLRHIKNELEKLEGELKGLGLEMSLLEEKIDGFESINKKIWDYEEIISCSLELGEKDGRFLEASWGSHLNNKRRFKLKQEVNTLFLSDIIETKSYV